MYHFLEALSVPILIFSAQEKLTYAVNLSIQLQFESYLEKLAVDSLKMNVDEYKQIRDTHTQDWIIDELQKRSLTKGLTTYNLRTLREALLRNQTFANRTHQEWQPAEVRGTLTECRYPYNCVLRGKLSKFPLVNEKNIKP